MVSSLQGPLGLWAIPLAPLLAACIAAVPALTRRGERATPLISLTGVLVAGAAAWANRPHWMSGSSEAVGDVNLSWLTLSSGFHVSLGVRLDHLASVMVGVVCIVSALVQLYSVGYMRGEGGYGRYFAYLSLFTASMLGLVVADNLFQLYVCWELVGICSYLLIGFWWHKPSAAAAAKKAFVVTRFGDVGFMLGLLFLACAAGSFDFVDVNAAVQRIGAGTLQGSPLISNQVFLWLVPLLLFCGAVGKSAQFPLHVWLPDAMEGPTPVSALIHAATMVAAGVYMVARLSWLFTWTSVEAPLRAPVAVSLDVILLVGAVTALIGATIALVQYDIKKVMAYSTISQLGYMMMAMGAGNTSGTTAGMFHLVTHAFFKALLFLTAGSVIHALHHADDPNDLRQMGGLRRRMPLTAVACGIGALALAGIAPLSGFWSKDAIVGVLLSRAGWLVAGGHGSGPLDRGADEWAAGLGVVVGLVVAALTAFYAARMWWMAFGGAARTRAAEHASEAPWTMSVPLVVLASASTGAGWFLHHGGRFETYLLGPSAPAPHADWRVMALTSALALGGVAVGWLLYRAYDGAADPIMRLPASLGVLFRRLWFIETAWGGVARAALAFGECVAWFDRNIIDGCVRGTGVVARRGGRLAQAAATGQAQTYACVLLAATVLLIVLLVAYEAAAGGSPVATAQTMLRWAGIR